MVNRRPPVVLFWREGIARAIDAMWTRLSDPVTLHDLARTAAMSPFHFDRVFRQLTGIRPFQFFSAIRLVKARELLLSTNAPVANICLDVGYNSLGTFTRRFAEQVGAPPLRLRQFSRRAPKPLPASDTSPRPSPPRSQICVRLTGVPEGSLTFVGAFPARVPVGRPAACALSIDTNSATLDDVPEGHYLLAAALPLDAVLGGSLGDGLLVGAAADTAARTAGERIAHALIELRPVEITDPPIVSFLPLLLREHFDDDAADST